MDLPFLQSALDAAATRRGFAAPNPAVGAVVVKDGVVLGVGAHFGAGHPHAEVEALKNLGEAARGATVYVTLEPCCHFGRTPPCTNLLIEKKVARVVYGYRDPNPKVAGGGEAALKAAGIACEHVATPAIDAFYESYTHWTHTGRPFVTAKIAVSLDGKIAGENDARVAITSEAINAFTHECRKMSDAILTTARTVNLDDPLLNAREKNATFAKPIYVIDRASILEPTAKIFTTGARITVLQSDLESALDRIGRDGHHDLWVEAGGTFFQSLVGAGLCQKVLWYVGGKILGENARPAFGSGSEKLLQNARRLEWKAFGPDALLEVRF